VSALSRLRYGLIISLPPGRTPLKSMLSSRVAESGTVSKKVGKGATALQICGCGLIPENPAVRQTTSSFGVPPIRARSDQVALQRRMGVKVSGFSKSGVRGGFSARFDPAPGRCRGWRFLPLSRKPDSFSPGLLGRHR
jgi:hypothetical protein